ncbi:MAG TPA: hypothetical protein VN176_17340 [Verrucomicrobiae bacterium]|jgi:hypothetical protein|nr:hypothetical protein [Verrucomicrobiae bacterium]
MKILHSSLIAFSLILCFSSGLVARQANSAALKCDEKIELPYAVRAALKRAPDLTVSCRLSPPVIQGDFGGNGSVGYAVLVTQKTSQRRGFLISFGGGRSVVAGAGRPVQYGAAAFPDLNFDHWELYSKSRPVESDDRQEPLKLHGDALLVSYHEDASGLFYWDGKRVRWYQQGD